MAAFALQPYESMYNKEVMITNHTNQKMES
jgi:hypothetical protein